MVRKFRISFDTQIKVLFSDYDKLNLETISMYPASSEDNDFIPYHALQCGRLVTVGNQKTLLYSLEVHKKYEKVKNHEDFFDKMMTYSTWYRLVKKNIPEDYRARRGQLVYMKPNGQVDLLATLAVSKSHLFNINKANPDYSKFFIIISKNFTTVKHSNLYKSFTKYYLDEARNYVDMIWTKDIQRLCYNHAPIQQIMPRTIKEAKSVNSMLTEGVVTSILNKEIF